MTLLYLTLAAFLEVAGDYVIRIGLAPHRWGIVVLGGALLALYGERIDAARALGGALIVSGGCVIQFWR
jgi:hypothetical protein